MKILVFVGTTYVLPWHLLYVILDNLQRQHNRYPEYYIYL